VVRPGGQQIGREIGPANSDAEQLMVRSEVLNGAYEEAAGTEGREGNPTAKRLHVVFILEQTYMKMYRR
jgi:hypothetical protein